MRLIITFIIKLKIKGWDTTTIQIVTNESLFTCYEIQIANQHDINVDIKIELKQFNLFFTLNCYKLLNKL